MARRTHQDDITDEIHIADVRIPKEWILEFQNSPLDRREQHEREKFYGKLVWVINGLRRPTFKEKFYKIIHGSKIVVPKEIIFVIHVRQPNRCSLLKRWRKSDVPVLLDFGEPMLWALFPSINNERVCLSQVPRKDFIDRNKDDRFDTLMNEVLFNATRDMLNDKRCQHKLNW